MPADVYGPEIEKVLKRTRTRGVTRTVIADEVGCTTARVRQWMRRNGHLCQAVGTDDNGATLWVWNRDVEDETGESVLPAIRVGEQLRVASMRRVGDHAAIVELRDADGHVVVCTVTRAVVAA